MWDNRATKKSPRMPDYKCKNYATTGCDGVIWPPKGTTPTPVIEYQGQPSFASTPATKKHDSMLMCNAMNNAAALVIGGSVNYEDLATCFKDILEILESNT